MSILPNWIYTDSTQSHSKFQQAFLYKLTMQRPKISKTTLKKNKGDFKNFYKPQ